MSETNWEERYQVKDTPWEKGDPSPGLVDFLKSHPELEKGRVAIPGCGFGHDVQAWAEAGFEACGFDLAPSAVRLASERFHHPRAQFKQANFLVDPPPQPFDWLFEHTLYCAILPEQRSAYANALARWLKPKGQFLAVHYFIPDTDGPPFGTDMNEVTTRFSPNFELIETWVPRSYPNRTNLEQMFWWRRK